MELKTRRIRCSCKCAISDCMVHTAVHCSYASSKRMYSDVKTVNHSALKVKCMRLTPTLRSPNRPFAFSAEWFTVFTNILLVRISLNSLVPTVLFSIQKHITQFLTCVSSYHYTTVRYRMKRLCIISVQ